MNKRQRVSPPKPVTVLELWRKAQQNKCSTDNSQTNSLRTKPVQSTPPHLLPSLGNENQEEWLQLYEGVFELSGEAGAGKTQVALSLCQRSALSAPSESVGPTSLYLSLGAGRLPKALQRLQQMASCSGLDTTWLLKILTKPLLQRDDWIDFLREADAFFHRHGQTLRLVVVDSLADLVRDDFGHFTQFDRTTWLLSWVQRCRVLAERHQLTWLFVNQQATCVSANGVWQSKPALGLAWAHAVSGSWICHRALPGQQQRRLVLHKSNRFPVGQMAWFVIQNGGVQRVVEKVPEMTGPGASAIMSAGNSLE